MAALKLGVLILRVSPVLEVRNIVESLHCQLAFNHSLLRMPSWLKRWECRNIWRHSSEPSGSLHFAIFFVGGQGSRRTKGQSPPPPTLAWKLQVTDDDIEECRRPGQRKRSSQNTNESRPRHFLVRLRTLPKKNGASTCPKVLSAFAVFSPCTWPRAEDDRSFGDDCINLLDDDHFSYVLAKHKHGYSPSHCIAEWDELKQFVREYMCRNKNWKFAEMWRDILQSEAILQS